MSQARITALTANFENDSADVNQQLVDTAKTLESLLPKLREDSQTAVFINTICRIKIEALNESGINAQTQILERVFKQYHKLVNMYDDYSGKPPFLSACESKNKQLIKFFLKITDVDFKAVDKSGANAASYVEDDIELFREVTAAMLNMLSLRDKINAKRVKYNSQQTVSENPGGMFKKVPSSPEESVTNSSNPSPTDSPTGSPNRSPVQKSLESPSYRTVMVNS